MARKVGVTPRTAPKAAVEQRRIPANVALAAKLPKVRRYVPKVFTPDQVAAFTAAAAADRYGAMFSLPIDSGCRQGELFALTWSDLDAATGVLSATKALAYREGKRWAKDVKRDRSRRAVVLGWRCWGGIGSGPGLRGGMWRRG